MILLIFLIFNWGHVACVFGLLRRVLMIFAHFFDF